MRESGGMADTLDLGSSALGREGSSPFSRMRDFMRESVNAGIAQW
ncbi:MAG: hypothetical protein FD137_2131 [Spirochaetes bacterium]|nr:MAG: hypothetical protein FD137_2131 [Spirochaetota bacterium]